MFPVFNPLAAVQTFEQLLAVRGGVFKANIFKFNLKRHLRFFRQRFSLAVVKAIGNVKIFAVQTYLHRLVMQRIYLP